MKNLKLNLKGLCGYRQSLLPRSPQPRDNREMSERRPSEERTLLVPLPQRFARYAAMLIMLLTLGVGNAWADNNTGHTLNYPYFYYYNDDSWSDVQAIVGRKWDNWNYSKVYPMGKSDNVEKLYFAELGDNWPNTYNQIAVLTGASSWGGEGNHIEDRWGYAGGHSTNVIWNYDMSYHNTYYWAGKGASSIATSVQTYTTTLNIKVKESGADSYSNGSTSDKPASTIKITGTYADGTGTWGTKRSDASWSSGSSCSYNTVISGKVTPSYSSKNDDWQFDGWYVGSTRQSTEASYDFYQYAATTIEARFTRIKYAVNFDQQSGSDGTTSIKATYGSAMPSITLPTRAGYDFQGYFTETGGAGTKYYNADGTSAKNSDLNTKAGTTLYAYWTPHVYSITLDKNGGDSDGSATITYLTTVFDTHSAPTQAGWSVEGYYTDDATPVKIADSNGNLLANKTGYTNASSQWTKTSDATLYAHWKQTYSVTYYPNFPEGTTTSGAAPTDANEYNSGATVTVLGVNTMSATGYSFAGWNTNAEGTGTSRAAGSTFSISGNTPLYAQWTENMRSVTISVSPSGAGTLNKNSASVGVATTTTVTATAYPGYKFTGWTATNCSVEPSSSASTTLSGNGTTGDATLVANFVRTYAFVEGRFQVKNAARTTTTYTGTSSNTYWSTASRNIEFEYDETNHRFFLHTHMQPKELAAQLSSNTQYFTIQTSTSEATLTGGSLYTPASTSPTSAQQLSEAGLANKKATSTTTNRDDSFWFTSSDNSGYTILYFDEAGVWYELEQSLKYDANGGSGDAPTPAYYLKGTNAPAASNPFTARTNYTFAGWNTDQYITGTNYAAGASVPMNTNRMLYAKWDRTVTLEQEGATTEGSTTVIGTWNCATLPAITNPEKIGYTFGGWYTEVAGAGNLIIDTEGVLQADKTNWTDASGRFQRTPSAPASESKPLYAKWTQTVTLNANLANHGSGDNTSATIVYKATGKTSITHCTPATGYHLEGYYTAATDGVKVLNADGSFAAATVTDYITDSKWTKAGATTLYAHYEPNTYDVILDVNGATTGSNQTVTATFNADMPTTQKGGSTPISAPSKTGYTFGGYWTNAAGTGTQYYTSGLASNHVWDVATNNTTIYAKWTANPYTVTLDKQTDVTGYGGTEGTVADQTVTFDATPATVSGTMPSAANGYCFMGFYSEAGGNGRCFIDPSGNWVTAAGDTISGGHWVKPAGITLYAYYKKAEITEVTLSTGSTVAPSTTGITATATLAPTPAGTTHIDWRILYSNDNPLATQPNFGTGTTTNSFTAPETSGTYKLEATLRTGSTANSGTLLDSYVLAFQVAGDHTVTVQYKCGDEVIRASASVTGKPLTPTEITAPDIVGYTFSKWKAGDGITIEGADGNGEKAYATINFTAIYDGKLTAIYTKKQMIYFNNTLGWEDVWVYFYNDASGNKYWSNNYGTGANKQQSFNYNHPYWEQEHGQMTQIEGTDIWYFDFQSEDWYSTTRTKVAFVNKDQSIDKSGATNDEAFFHNASVIYRVDFDATNLPMFVPIDAVEYDYTTNTGSKYYRGYWMNYPESTGYTLKIYNKKEKANDFDSEPAEIRSIPFEFTADKTMPMELDVDLEAGKTYGFKIYCNNDTWLGNNGTMTATTPNWDLSTGTSNCGLTTTAAGNYKFTLNYFAVSSTDYKLRIGVTYPVAAGDYQVLYKDDTMSEWFISSVVPAASDKDTVSFFVRKDEHPVLKLQKCSSVGEGTVTWSDTVANLISVLPSAITQDSVYIFCLNKNAEGKRELGDVKAYTGNYYIRTDCAGTTKWDNYRAADHLMTYSEYSEKNSDFTHYFVAHVESGNNVKFVVANDYSPNISDTLEISTYRGGDGDHIEDGGNIKANANVRFMWDRRKNAVYRAYLDEAKSDGSRFLVLRANSSEDLMDENGNALTSGNNHGAPDNSIQFVDNENWIYETNVMVKPSAYVKLYGHFHGQDFYFKGESGDDFNGEDGDSDGIANAIQLMTGTGEAQKVRVIYDFKTDRLLAAWMPSGEIGSEHEINADVMFVREGQGDIDQLVFVDEDLDGNFGSITAIKSAYGVMRFNKWTLNNKDKDTHSVLSSPASIYERSLFWISFPFRVKLSEVFGFGTYGVDWAIQRYDGAERAEKGFWAESSGFWKWMDRNTEYLEPDQGYLLAIDLDLLGESASVWNNGVEQIELYFPSYGTMPDITSAAVEHTLLSHACTIDWSERSNGNGGTLGSAYNRTIKDSHWNVMSVPTYVNTSNIAFANTTWTNTIGPNFLYTWNASDNTLTPTAGAGYHYHAMHAYMVQYHEKVTWTASSGSPYPIVARRTYAEQPKKVNFCLEIQQNEKMIDRTFVQLSDDEEVSAEFSFGEDMGKEFNSRKANIYTVIEGYLQAAGNTLPMSDQTTLVPVGVKTTAAGEYTFAMPEGTKGVSVVLIDNIAGTRTNLSLSDYTVALGKGDLSDRFMLEIAPIKQMPTDVENVPSDDVQSTNVRKVMVDGILYIVKDGKVFDARGAKVK